MNRQKNIYIYIATVLSLIAGMLHATIVAFEHVAPLPLETLFFLGGGLAQIVLSVLVLQTQRLKYVLPLFVVNGSIAFLWLLTRIFRAPFMDNPEEVGTLGLLVFIFEIVALLLLSVWKWSHRHRIREVHGYVIIHIVMAVFVLSLLSGGSVYGGGMLGEIVMPERTLTHGHAGDYGHDGKGDPHVEDDDHEETPHVDEVPHDDERRNKKAVYTEEDNHIDEIPHD